MLDPNIFYLVGEKGTGKTAYATFLANNEYKNHKVSIFDVRQTEYQKFLELKKQGHLPLSEYAEVWRTLLLIATATTILALSEAPSYLRRFTKLNNLKSAIDDFYGNAFAPELVKIISFVQSSERSAGLLVKHLGLSSNVSAKSNGTVSDSNTIFQTNLLRIRRAFEAALSEVAGFVWTPFRFL